LQNKAKPVLTVRSTTRDSKDALSMFTDWYTNAVEGKETAFKDVIGGVVQLVNDGVITKQQLDDVYNNTLSVMPKDATYEEVVMTMAQNAVSYSNVDDFNKAFNTNLNEDAFARWKSNAVEDVITYQVNEVKQYAVNEFISTTMDNVMTDNMLNVVEYAVKNNPDIWIALGKANIPAGLGDKDWGDMSKEEQKNALKALAGANPTDFLTIYAQGGGDINGLVQIMYGQTITSTGGPIGELNNQYTLAFANMSDEQLANIGVLEGLDEMYKPSNGGKVKSAAFVKAPLGFGTGFIELTMVDADGNSTKKVVDVSKSTDAANIGLLYWSDQLNEWTTNPPTASKTAQQQEIDKAKANWGALALNNTLSPVVGERGMSQVARSNVSGKDYKVVPVKFMGKTEYQLFEIVAGREMAIPNANGRNSYDGIEAINMQITNEEYGNDYTGAPPAGQRKVATQPGQGQETENE
jgi:hypothetical protein